MDFPADTERVRVPRTILVAEDEALSAMALVAQLEALGHRVLGPVREGLQAVELAGREPVDIVLMDVGMPRLSGLAAARRIFADRPVPIVLLSGYNDPELIEEAARIPVVDYLVKPVTLERLAESLEEAESRFREWCADPSSAERLGKRLLAGSLRGEP